MSKRFLFLGLPALLLGLSISSFNFKKDGETSLKIGDKAPLTTSAMVGTDGKTYTLSELKKEKGLVVIFSCNTCPFVVGSESFAGWEVQYNALSKVASENNFGMVLVNSNEAKRTGDDSLEAMKKRATEKGYTVPYVVDQQSALANAFGAKTTPHVYVFDENMTLIYQGAIDNGVDSKRTSDIPYLAQALKEHKSGAKITTNTTPPRGCSIKRVAIN